jgi:hypothetical protein
MRLWKFLKEKAKKDISFCVNKQEFEKTKEILLNNNIVFQIKIPEMCFSFKTREELMDALDLIKKHKIKPFKISMIM